ncbi:MAG: crossover junction endodeoxyribonuclease RuvC [Candidatus Aminicenantes bacterium]|nr:crossover junction endodeoxyribonuclease RuvC [Candidatus Aminicenantes bacterium]MBL7082043.1 crossover junction endodeoxyribonuclease RuvC [Candidatus Aminicenantes bacterium]NQT80296.1 crossover junction endodeoxyribonuclease RuvC [Candidatus Aminicenantes bacterium]
MRVLGIDPSLQSTGFGIIEFSNNTYTVLSCGTIKPSRSQLLHHKINKIKLRLEELIKNYEPEEVAIENPFFARNIKTAITLGQVRGAALVAVASHNCTLFEYSPLEIKKAVTGYGQADKNQVRIMIKTLLNIKDENLETDASDALATAFCHLNLRTFFQKIKES